MTQTAEASTDRGDFERGVEQFSDPRWRLNNLYWIQDEEGRRVKFEMNWTQEKLFAEMWYLNLVLKARQLGFTTFIQLFMLDACLFNSNVAAGTIAHTLQDAINIFERKAKYPYDNLPDGLKAARTADASSARQLRFNNGSRLEVGTSLRSGTFQYLHISEHGKICARYPEKAREIRTGALNTVHAGQMVFIESTAEGREGDFFDFCQQARNHQRTGRDLTKLDYKFQFFPWWRHPGYVLDPAGVVLESRHEEYFRKLEVEEGITLTPEQKAWYVKKLETQNEEMGREFPSTADEAFAASIEGAYFSREMAKARKDGRISSVPHDPSIPVNTFWDLGVNDMNCIWFHQRVGHENRFIDYYENHGEGLAHYVQALQSKGYTYGEHYFPHDVEVMELGTGKSRAQTLRDLGLRTIRTVPRTADLLADIHTTRNAIAGCWFDEARCATGIKHLDAYRKEWDDRLGVWKDRPRHDEASHGADAFRTFAIGYRAAAPLAAPPQVGMTYDPFDPTAPIGGRPAHIPLTAGMDYDPTA